MTLHRLELTVSARAPLSGNVIPETVARKALLTEMKQRGLDVCRLSSTYFSDCQRYVFHVAVQGKCEQGLPTASEAG